MADLVGISTTRELAPLMTAIIVCGRSGAAFTAEIGSMKVSEELDALRTLGLPPAGWLVVPRVLALLLVAPVLTLLADVIAAIGGGVVAVTSLDLTARGVPPPRYPLLRFAGVLAPNSPWRSAVVPGDARAGAEGTRASARKARKRKGAKGTSAAAERDPSMEGAASLPSGAGSEARPRSSLATAVVPPPFARIDGASLIRRVDLEDVLRARAEGGGGS